MGNKAIAITLICTGLIVLILQSIKIEHVLKAVDTVGRANTTANKAMDFPLSIKEIHYGKDGWKVIQN